MATAGCMAASVGKVMMPITCKRGGDLNMRNRCIASQEYRHHNLRLRAAGSFIISPSLQSGGRRCLLPRRRIYASPKASNKYSPSRLNHYPPMTKKPRWWWRTLASIPYLIPLHATWRCAEQAFYLRPFLEEFEFFVDSFDFYLSSYPQWFWMAYSMALYLGVVRRRQWPHFLRFHVVNSVLLENLLDVTMIVCGWLPRLIFRGRAGLHFWTAVAVAYLFTVLECIRCAYNVQGKILILLNGSLMMVKQTIKSSIIQTPILFLGHLVGANSHEIQHHQQGLKLFMIMGKKKRTEAGVSFISVN